MNETFPEISLILPCLNEEPGLGRSLEQITIVIQTHHLHAEVVVIDNGSTDRSRAIAANAGARVVEEKETGYGAACLKGLSAAKGKFLLIMDADASYDFNQIPLFIDALRNGADFVIGNRFAGTIEHNAMPWIHRHIGNPVLSGILRLFFNSSIHDAHCGMRGLTQQAFHALTLKTTGMEFASEMIIQIQKRNLTVKEIPINYRCRLGQSKLKSFADGWRHLRFMLLYSPFFLFFLPGLFLFLTGAIFFALTYFNIFSLRGIHFQSHPLFVFALLIITGYQLMIFALFAKTYAITHLGDTPIFEKYYRYITIEKASLAGLLLGLTGLLLFISILLKWVRADFGMLNEINNAVLGLTLTTIGIQTIFSSFMLSILGIKER
ncbi:MAG TPA: glycosyltransferase family 2 protein [Candidatus Bathyarchaeia archaeon]|nr:glycosyltransferase family 2 protein [Candidatus Bathyarchaeia archaeon]